MTPIDKDLVEFAEDICKRPEYVSPQAERERRIKEISEALQQVRNEAFAEAAKYIEQNGWNDTIPITVNMKEVAFRYANAIRSRIGEGK